MRRVLEVALLGCALGCSGGPLLFTIPPPGPTSSLPPEPGTRVGTARVDVTPPPGPSTWGHGPDAIATQGYWTRLECRVFVIEANGPAGSHGELVRERYAIVPCDLPAISYSLFRMVAQQVAGIVAADHILLTATHTHAGPGHYFESGIYSGFLSSRRAGFDTDMLKMLSARIGGGIREAAHRVTPAELRWVSTRVFGMTRNRSLQALAMNGLEQRGTGGALTCPSPSDPPHPALSDEERKKLLDGPCKNLGIACEEIDPLLSMLEVREVSSGRSLGSITFFAMHPTVLPAHTRLFGADAFGIASRDLERRMRLEWAHAHPEKPASDPLAAIVNTNEGDIAPVWIAGDIDETRRIGKALAAAAWEAHTPAATPPPAPVQIIKSRLVEADMAKAVTFLQVDSRRPAELGQGSSHGGSDHATSIDDVLSRLADWQLPGDEQEPKTQLLGSLDHPLAGRQGFPSIMPFSLWQIGERWIAGVPAELTLTTGFRVRRAIATSTGAELDHVIVAGLANSYMQYVATCEEYQLQHYEGGSTLYGPRSESFVSSVEGNLGCQLARAPHAACPYAMPPGIEAKPFRPFDVKPDADRTHERYPQPQSERPAQLLNVCQLPQARLAGGLPRVCLRWLDSSPGDIPLAARTSAPGPWLGVRLKGQTTTLRWDAADPQSFLDDLGDEFQVRARADCGEGTFGYSAILEVTADEWAAMSSLGGAPGQPRFSLFTVDPKTSQDRLVADFDQNTPLCERAELLYCLDQYDAAASPLAIACHGVAR